MDTPDSAIPEYTTEDDDIEITDLEMPVSMEEKRLASFQLGVLKLQRPLSRRKFRLLTTLSILLLVALIIFTNVQSDLAILGNARDIMSSFLIKHHLLASNVPPAPVSIKPSVVILPQRDGFACVMDTTWSPDSKYVALLGYRQDCELGGNAEPGLLTIHNASSGRSVRSFLLNELVTQAFRSQYANLHTQADIYYHLVLWSHDKYHLAVLFYATFFHEPQAPSFDGVLLLDANGGPPKVFLREDQNISTSYLVWDMQQGTEYGAPPGSSGISSASRNPGFTISPSILYRWSNGGGTNELQAVQSGKGSALSHNAIGNPDGGSFFTFWQPGRVVVTASDGNGSVAINGVATWSTYFAAWSPDGRYIVDNLLIDGRFIIPGQPPLNHQMLVSLNMDLLPALPVRDKALQGVLQMLFSNPNTYPTGFASASVSWRFDGNALAAYGAGDPYNTSVSIYRCTDGAQVATLLPSSSGPGTIGGGIILRWSNDGSRVLLFNVDLATVTIWNVPSA